VSKLRTYPLMALACMLLLLAGSAMCQIQEKILHAFEDGSVLSGNLMFDSAGNIYGTADQGGATGNGSVYELSPGPAGVWNFNVLYSFTGGDDGSDPVAGLVMDGNGDLYGTTSAGGAYGSGTVFELVPSLPGQWSESVLYSFGGYPGDGAMAESGLVLDAAGNLYGTTGEGGSTNCTGGCGTVYELTSSGNGQWSESALYSFLGGDDGYNPVYSGVVFDGQGNLYGTTAAGGSSGCHHSGCGTVYELTPSQSGGWTENILHTFNGRDGFTPESGVVFDSLGNLYGTTEEGGTAACNTGSGGCGTVFRLSAKESGAWSLLVLHQFGGSSVGDGANPVGSLTFDQRGRLYGTTSNGGVTGSDFGSVFQLKRSGTKVVEAVFGNFGGAAGEHPNAGVILDSAGNVLSTTFSSASDGGVVFELTK
jgi:uncharacterized repeat protein (TIGR03803 family)